MVGYTLRQERERQNLTIEDIEEGTSIRALYIEAIENGEYDKMPGTVYTKGFIKNYAKFLGLDPDATVKEFMGDIAELSAEKEPPATEETAAQALQMATEFGAEALGLKNVGRLEEGCKADIVLWDMSGVDWQPNYNPASLLVYSANAEAVDTVIVNGKILMKGRELKTLDEEKICAEFTACANRLTGN